MDKKNTLMLTVIAVATLLVAVVGATFAYFTATENATGSTTVTTKTEKVGSVAVNNPTNAMYLDLTAAQMTQEAAGENGASYWATKTEASKFSAQAEHQPVAQVSVTGSETSTTYNCTFTLTVTKPTQVKTGDAALVLTLTDATISGVTSGEEIDLSEAGTYTVEFSQTGNATNKTLVTAAIKLNNLTTTQDHLAGQTLTTTIANSGMSCTVASK